MLANMSFSRFRMCAPLPFPASSFCDERFFLLPPVSIYLPLFPPRGRVRPFRCDRVLLRVVLFLLSGVSLLWFSPALHLLKIAACRPKRRVCCRSLGPDCDLPPPFPPTLLVRSFICKFFFVSAPSLIVALFVPRNLFSFLVESSWTLSL